MKRCLTITIAALFSGCAASPVRYDYRALPDPTQSPYRVQAGDVVHIRVMRNENASGRYMVRPDGHISIPLGGEIKVVDFTTEQLRQQVVARLTTYIEDAKDVVSVALEQVRGLTYSVIGEVTRPGSFESPRYVTLLEALATAGGLSPYADPGGIYVLRVQGNKRLKIPISYAATVKDPSGNRNFHLMSGDIIVVP